MRLIARNVLLAYARTHPQTEVPLERWYRLVKAANWTSMDDIRRAAPKSRLLNRDRVRFEVSGRDYRPIVAFGFPCPSETSRFRSCIRRSWTKSRAACRQPRSIPRINRRRSCSGGYPTRRPARGSEAIPRTVIDRALLSFDNLNPVALGILHIVILFPGVPVYPFPCVVGDVAFAYFSPRDFAGR